MFFSPIPGRSQYTSFAGPRDKALSEREFLTKTLAAVKRRRGLIHGDLMDGKRACALGALAASCGGSVTVAGETPRKLQEFNDSMPKATPAVRRLRVIEWLEKRISRLPKEVS